MCQRAVVEDGDRTIEVNAGFKSYPSLAPGYGYADNNVITSQYTWYNFVFKNLAEQFSNLANLYFLLVGVFQIIPSISTTGGLPTMYQPLAFIVLVSAARAISEDYGKHRADSIRNSYRYDVLSPSGTEWHRVKSGDLAVGNIARVRQDEMIPTDMIFLGSSLAQGHCFIDKANLNGETKLEVYSALRETRVFCPPLPEAAEGDKDAKQSFIDGPPPASLAKLRFQLTYEPPNKRFDSFRGVMLVHNESGQVDEVRVDGKSLLMRETNLKNTDFIYGLIVYTGNDTKIQRSNLEGEKARVKVSRIMRQVNSLLKYMLLAQAACCLAGGIAAGAWAYQHGNDWYMRYDGGVTLDEAVITAVLAFFTWFINLSQMVPISLIVSGEMVKFIMSRFINWDTSLYHAPINKATHCNSSTIHEDLGLIDYVFSDKTGTLTQNKMEFRYALLSNQAEFGSRETEIAKAVAQRNKELLQRQQGTYKPSPMPRWTVLMEPYLPAKAPNPETGYDVECCIRRCPRLCHKCWFKKKTHQELAAEAAAAAAAHGGGDGDDSYPDDTNRRSNSTVGFSADGGYNSEDPSSRIGGSSSPRSGGGAAAPGEAAAAAGSEANTFNTAEREALLRTLYGPAPAGISAEAHKTTQERLHLYMMHMALSNTVKPFYKNGRLEFQPESAEELAMAQFAQKCGYTKLPEKEDKEKTPEEKRSHANTRVQIQRYDTRLRPAGEPEERRFAFLACLGFTSQRARVTVIYQDEQTKEILIMIKGQDGMVLPLLTLPQEPKYEETLLSALKNLSNNGLRTLIAGHSQRPADWWTAKWGPEYQRVKEMSEADDEARRKIEHDLFEQIEKDCTFQYIGCLGMEDQLQPLVPDCIQACLRAGVKVWMITGDKLETARNIGLACNLIDADMQPQIHAGDTLATAMSAFSDSRLIQVTGEWHSMFENSDELSALFDSMDYNKDGIVSIEELSVLLQSLQAGIDDTVIRNATQLLIDAESAVSPETTAGSAGARGMLRVGADGAPSSAAGTDAAPRRANVPKASVSPSNGPLPPPAAPPGPPGIDLALANLRLTTHPGAPSAGSAQQQVLARAPSVRLAKKAGLTKEGFMHVMRQFKRTPFEAVSFDVDEGIKRYLRIQDPAAFPVSLLVNRDAFLVMFPGKAPRARRAAGGASRSAAGSPGGSVSASSLHHDDVGATEEQLEDLRRKFFFLASVSKSVVFARAQPAMKKKMVTEIQARVPAAVTLAIGDGANDTDMITAAHIGVGIAGVEGTAATNSADYAIGTFRMLHTLLFVHGYWSYQRVSNLVNFIFYKAALVAIVQFIFGFYSGFSGQQFFNDQVYQLYNVIFTAFPIISVAVLDKALPRNTLEDNPVAFREAKYKAFNGLVFFSWLLRSLVHGIIIFLVPMTALNTGVTQANDGRVTGLWFVSTTIFFATALLPTFFIFFLMQSINIFHVIAVFVSLFSLYVIPIILNSEGFSSLAPDLLGVVYLKYSSPLYWLTVIMALIIPILFELSVRYIVREVSPSFTQILQEKLILARRVEKMLTQELRRTPDSPDAKPRQGAFIEPEGGSAFSGQSLGGLGPSSTSLSAFGALTTGAVGTSMSASSIAGKPVGGALSLGEDPTVAITRGTKGRRAVLARPVISPEDEERWTAVHGGSSKVSSAQNDQLKRLREEAVKAAQVQAGGAASGDGETGEERLRSALVRAMLRFRNQTGAQFDSAAQAKYQKTVTIDFDDEPAPLPSRPTFPRTA